MRYFYFFVLFCLSACAPAAQLETRAPQATPTFFLHQPGVADILKNPPPAQQPFEMDAYFSGVWGMPFSGGPAPPPDVVPCPYNFAATLTDRPFRSFVQILNSTQSNALPADAAWLVAVTPGGLKPGVREIAQLPYHARLRGYLGEPALAHCENAAHIFVAQDVVRVYEQNPPDAVSFPLRVPDDFAAWQSYHDDAFGFTLKFPRAWKMTPLQNLTDTLAAWELRADEYANYPVQLRVYPGETHLDQYDNSKMPPLLGNNGYSVYEQGITFDTALPTQKLAGYIVEEQVDSRTRVILNAHGNSYVFSVDYPIGFEFAQELLTTYSTIVESFRFETAPGASPTPPIQQELGRGPFISQSDALTHVPDAQDAVVIQAELISEAEARRRADACNTFEGHADGVWFFQLHLASQASTEMLAFVNAVNGKFLCGEETEATTEPAQVETPTPNAPPSSRTHEAIIYF